MTAVGVSSGIFRDIFSTEPMRRIFADENRIQKYLDIEAALARAQARLGIIPQDACDEICRHCRAQEYDFAKLKAQTERIGYPVLPVVQQLVSLCRDGLGEWCHWGATTQDITDTATVLQIREALDLVEADIVAIADALAGLARRYRDTPMAGRSNLQQAVPITFGYKVATYLAAFERHRQRLQELRPRVLVGEFGGAAGTLSSLGTSGLEVQAALMKELGLGQPEIAWHTVRDRIAEVGCFLGLVTGVCGKIAFDVKLMMQTEVEEVYEPFHEGRGSSSTMPQKRNPISCVYITATNSLVRQHVAALLDAMVEDHERATGPWEIEWIAVPEIFSLAAGALAQTRFDGVGPRGRREEDARQSRHHPRADRLGSGDDGARPPYRPAICPRPRLRHLPAGGGDRPHALRPARRKWGGRQASRPRRAGKAVRPRQLSRPGRGDGRPRAGHAGEVSKAW